MYQRIFVQSAMIINQRKTTQQLHFSEISARIYRRRSLRQERWLFLCSMAGI